MENSKLTEVYSAADPREAHLIATVLVDAGIDARAVGDHLQNAVGELPFVAIAPKVWVRAENAEQAREIIARFDEDRQKTKAGETLEWTCDDCGETNEPSFDLCWNCQVVHSQ